jgi:hypothetical protein
LDYLSPSTGGPNQVNSDWVRLRRGIFGSCEFRPDLLQDASPIADSQSAERVGAARLTIKGTPIVKITLRHRE